MNRAVRSGVRRWVTRFAVVALIGAALAVAPAQAPGTSAAVAADWDPGYIIDDSVFYDSAGMTAAEVQTFLNGKVKTCAGGATCLKAFTQATDNRPADQYCNGYSAGARESAAEIIDKVARSCGINQRVLLVLLEKEQGLVTSTAPSAWSYSAATGQGCPDTQPCNSATQGFFYQVYYAARQFEIYRMNPNSFGYRAQRTNNILYNPSTACGTRSVFINNQATAALYIYTPYTPNAAALANMYGTGDGCSSYGNRNFWRTFTDWFGNPRSYSPHPGFVDYWNAHGGPGGSMGSPASYPVFSEANGQGWYQRFERGVVYGSFTGGTAFVFDNIILAEYNRQGGPAGGMGWPSGEQTCSSGVRCFQSFVSATVTTTAQYGAHVIWGGLDANWRSSGGLNGPLGAAVNDVSYQETSSGPAWVQHFERGIAAESWYGLHFVPYSAILSKWSAEGGGAGWLGWPRGAYVCSATGCAQQFSGGVVSSSAAYGAHVISGGYVGEWERRGGVNGIGPAYNDLAAISTPIERGWVQNFAAGILAQSGVGIFLVPYGPGEDLWSASGALRGSYGWPVSERTCATSGCGQDFRGGSITESASWGVHATFGGIAKVWRYAGGITNYGAALTDLRSASANGGGWAQHFASGLITQRRGAEPIFTPYGRIIDVWFSYGAETTWLGWPAGPQSCTADGCIQQFQNGVARSSPSGAVSFLPR